MAERPQQTDLTARTQIVFTAFLLFVILNVWSVVGRVWSPLLLVGNAVVAIGVAVLAQRFVIGFAARLVGGIHAAGDIPPPPSFSLQEAMIARGRYADAAESFRSHLAAHPGDHDARFALARLLEVQLQDYDAADRVYQEVRHGDPTPVHERMVANGLIDLYRKAGRRDRLIVELARFAERYRGTGAGDAAARELKELKTSSGG